jgi:PAS domain S-box-containing protein
MSAESSTVQILLAENAELRARLEEAEETLHAIRSGKVDALVLEGSAGPQIFTLQGLDAELNRFRGEILEQVNDAVIVIDDNNCITYLNLAAGQQYGVSIANMLGRCIKEIYQTRWIHPEDEVNATAALAETGRWVGENIHIKRNGKVIHVEISLSRLHPNSGVLAVIRDISERNQAEENLRRLNRTLQALSKSGRALIYAIDETEYLQEVCRIIVEYCGHAMVWVGFAENDAMKTVRPVASSGFEEGYLETLDISWADTELGRGPTGTAIRTGQVCRCPDMFTDPKFAPWRAEALKRGYASSVVFPLMVGTHCMGALTLYSREPAGFLDHELQLLTALVDDLAFGITTLRLRAAHTNSGQALRENEQRMRLATEATSVGIWEWNILTNQIHLDTQMFRIYGIEPTQDGFVQYATWSGSVLPEDLPHQEQEMQNVISQRKDCCREFRILRADDGQCRHIQAVETVRTNAQGQVEWLVGTNLDITERKLAETAIIESEERWRFALDVTQIGAWELNLADHTAWRSLRHDQIFGYEALLPVWTYEMFLQHVLEDDRPRVEGSFQRALATHQDWNFECRIRRIDGPVRWIWACGKSLNDASGHPIRMFGVVTDITERKQAEQELRDNARRKDEFLAMLAHELRNPLAPVRNAVEILKHANTDPARITWCTDIIDRQVTHLTGLVDDLLDVSRINRGQIELKKEALEIRDCIQPAIETSLPLIDARKQKLAITLPADLLWVEGDRIRLTQVVSNLINNAAKYTEEGGQISLSVEASGKAVCIRVSDNGCGIDPGDLSNLFDLFYQAERNLDRSQGGLGIGLSIVSNLVEMHGGNVQAYSAGLNQGSEFVVRLPQMMPGETSTSLTTVPGVSAQKCRILVVDDYRDVAESLAMLLEIDGHQVSICNEGPAALEIARTERPDIILLDIGLPEMSGYSVAQELRRNSELARTLLIAMTGYGRFEDREKSRAAGFDEHLVKPIDYEKLRELLINYRANKDKSEWIGNL